MKTALTFLSGVLLASSWWAAALWGHKIEGVGDLCMLWWIPSLLTLLAICAAIEEALNEP